MSMIQNDTFNEAMKEMKEEFLYTDFYGDSHTLGDYECRHEFVSLGVNNLKDWVKCDICGDIRREMNI